MAKREINYFTKINTDEDLAKFLQRKALIVLDVHQEVFGPTISLHATLELAKVSLTDSDKLHLAVCDAGKIEKLKRFRGKSLPTMIFCDEGKVIDILYGANIPLLLKTTKAHLEAREKAVQRTFYDFDEPLPLEKIELDKIKAEKDEVDRIKNEIYEKELFEKLDEVIGLMKENASDSGVTLFMPHVLDIAFRKTSDTARMLMLVPRARKIVQITQEMLVTLNYKLENPLDKDIIDYISGKDLLAVLWSADPWKSTEDMLNEFVSEVCEPMPVHRDDDKDSSSVEILQRVLDPLTIYLDGEEESLKSESNRDSRNSSLRESTVERQSSTEVNDVRKTTVSNSRRTTIIIEDDARPKLVIPPVWTPTNQEGNFMLMYTFFANQFEHFLPPIPKADPPHICMVFPAWKRNEIFSLVEENMNDVLAHGFFTSGDLEDCKLICKTPQKYEELDNRSSDVDVIILKVARQTSLMELTLSAMEPSYISQNPIKGAQECSAIFNESFNATEDTLTKKPNELPK